MLIFERLLTIRTKNAKILAMRELLNLKTPGELSQIIAANVKKKRKSLHLTQQQLSKKAGISYGSLKRFEQTGEIALLSLLKIAVVLDEGEEFTQLFAKKTYASIQEIIDEQNG